MLEHYIGLMSGTSLDGVDGVVLSIDQQQNSKPLRLITAHYAPFTDELRRALFALQTPSNNELHQSALLSNQLSHCYASTVTQLLEQSGMRAQQISAIGCHGQTVRHRPEHGYTLQLFNPALLVEDSGISVVADFRSRDLAAGGQGAPLVPLFHDEVFRHSVQHRIIVNIGGMANITELAPGQETCGFDCGPGNVLLDAWIQRQRGERFDRAGEWASQGKCLAFLLERLLQHPFFASPPPKSCGREQFSLDWLDSLLLGDEAAVDVQATLLALTACSIARAIERFCQGSNEVYVCGGGAHNTALLQGLRGELSSEIKLNTSEALDGIEGLGVDWIEAAAFAWLAYAHITRRPGNIPNVTGARGKRVLGALYPAG